MSNRRIQNLGPQNTVERRKYQPRRRELSRALGEAVIKYEAERTMKEALEERVVVLEQDKYVDSLTGLLNRNSFDEKYPILVDIAHTNQEPLALLFADSNDLHGINKKRGHQAGDNILKGIAEGLTNTSRKTDFVARIGGDEFIVVLTGFKPIPRAEVGEQDLEQELVDYTIEKYQAALGLRATIGIALLQPGETARQLYARADAACTANKPAIDRSAA